MDNVFWIELPGGDVAVADLADKDLLAGFHWRRSTNGYVYADRGQLRIALHRLVAGAAEGTRIDHVNGDPLDNRTCNLRLASTAQNRANAGPNRIKGGKTSQYKGVSWASTKGKWLANIHVDGRTRYLGRFTGERAAARAYNAAAKEAWGEFARLNDV